MAGGPRIHGCGFLSVLPLEPGAGDTRLSFMTAHIEERWEPVHGAPYRPVPYRPERMEPAESLARSAELRDRMRQRRTVRRFSSDPVPEQVVRDAIACAATAPSGAHQQPWTFVLVRDQEIRGRIREAAEREERISYDGRLGEEWLAALRPLGTDAVKTHLTDAPALIVVFSSGTGWLRTASGGSTTTWTSPWASRSACC